MAITVNDSLNQPKAGGALARSEVLRSGFIGPCWPASPPVDGRRFREALGCFASGVTVVTAGSKGGPLAGLTANAFTSVSLDPPLVLVCIKRGSRSVAVLRQFGRFAVHVLRADQSAEARAFAASGPDKLREVDLAWSRRGNPVLRRYLVRLECELAAEYDGGDHGIFLGRVVDLDLGEGIPAPLTYFRGQLGVLAPAVPRPGAS